MLRSLSPAVACAAAAVAIEVDAAAVALKSLLGSAIQSNFMWSTAQHSTHVKTPTSQRFFLSELPSS